MPPALRFGIAIMASEPPDEFIQTVRLAEALGFDSIWIPDYRLYRDVYVSLTLAALNTTRVRLGCAVTNPYTRHPGLTAVGIASVDAVSNGRVVLGLGAGGWCLTFYKSNSGIPRGLAATQSRISGAISATIRCVGRASRRRTIRECASTFQRDPAYRFSSPRQGAECSR